MAYTAKSLADGQVAASKTTVYTVPGSTKAIVNHIRVFNNGPTTETVICYLKRSAGTSKKQGIALLQTNESADFIHKPVNLSTGDTIEMQTSNASTVDFFITGAEE